MTTPAKTSRTHAQIDSALEMLQDVDFRNHLGASVIGNSCTRYAWYVFRWAAMIRHEARMVRLFDRGNLEERRFTTWLRNAGIEVQEYAPGTRRQLRISAFEGHFGGSLDARLRNVPDIADADMWILGEFKTHNQKSFDKLKKGGVAGTKWTHYIQMQIYMYFTGMPAALYMAICKNDDELYTELVPFKEEIALEYITRAQKVITAQTPPPRISNSAGWFECKMCDMYGICHKGQPLAVNCRSCAFASPIADAQWLCNKYQYVLSAEETRRGCLSHSPIA